MRKVSAWRRCRAARWRVALVGPALAHHSPAAFEDAEEVTLVGTVKEFRWQNPHTWIEVVVPDEKDRATVLWAFELTSPTYLIRAGWKSNTIKPGDKVTIVGRPLQVRRAGRPSSCRSRWPTAARCSSGRRAWAARRNRSRSRPGAATRTRSMTLRGPQRWRVDARSLLGRAVAAGARPRTGGGAAARDL